MGNCLFLEKKPIRIMKTDGKILEYKAPTRVFQVLSDFSSHAISDSVPVSYHLHQNAKLLCGHLYFLIPIPVPSSSTTEVEKKPKRVQFSVPTPDEKEKDVDNDKDDDEKRISGHSESSDGGVIRIKLVMTKKELQQMIENGGISTEEMICRFRSGGNCRDFDDDFVDDDQLQRWKPALESIPESDVDC